MSNKSNLAKLNESFGNYKAEWLKGKIFDFFAEPNYFIALQAHRPCVLEGGRGTGKTTVLRGLSYQGQYAMHGNDIDSFDENDYIGIYIRVNSNHVRSFMNGGLNEEIWRKVFSHYINLLICRDMLLFIHWHKNLKSNDEQIGGAKCKLIAKSLHFNEKPNDFNDLIEMMELELFSFQSTINNISDENIPSLSLAGDPIKIVTDISTSLKQFNGKQYFILLDEYENFEDYQQQVVNTLIKHNTDNYVFKVGVRELGWRVKHTLNKSELLSDPADYALINIEQKLTEKDSFFSDFAKIVCQQRFNQIFFGDNSTPIEIEKVLGEFTIEEEAEILEVKETSLYKLLEELPIDLKQRIDKLPALYRYFISYWSNIQQIPLIASVDDYLLSPNKWNTRYDNYKYELLFKIRKGRGKRGIQKYYSGWLTYIKMANGNIRYLMELFYKTYEKHFNDNGNVLSPISPKTQTLAAQEVGLKNLVELESLWRNGSQLTKLLLGLGRVFQVLASASEKIAPEKNQFMIENSERISDEVDEILTAAVMNLALIRSPGNKLNSDYHTRDYIYMLHPIFSAYFEFSYRKKRKILIKQVDIINIIESPKKTITTLLKRSDIDLDFDFNLPNQLSLFEKFYKND